MPRRSRSGAPRRQERRRCIIQPRPGLSAWARGQARSCHGAGIVRARRAARPSRRPDQPWTAVVPERQSHRGDALAQIGRRTRRAARLADLWHGLVQRRRGRARSGQGLCLCQPRRGAGARPGQGNARPDGRDDPARRAAEGRRGGDAAAKTPGAVRRRRRRPPRRRRCRAQGQGRRPPCPAPHGRGHQSGGWRVQLGAFGQRASAEALFRKLSSGAPLAGKQSYLVAVGAVTRLQAGPFESRAAATAACAKLSARGQPCFPVAGR